MHPLAKFRAEAESIRQRRPEEITLQPGVKPFVGQLKVLRRRNGGYLVSVLDYDEQAAVMPDGNLAVEVLSPAQVKATEPNDRLAEALRRAHEALDELRLRSAFEVIARLRGDLDEPTLVTMLHDALESNP